MSCIWLAIIQKNKFGQALRGLILQHASMVRQPILGIKQEHSQWRQGQGSTDEGSSHSKGAASCCATTHHFLGGEANRRCYELIYVDQTLSKYFCIFNVRTEYE